MYPQAQRFPQLFWGLIALAAGLVISALAGASALRDIKRANDEVTVTGSARRPIRSDLLIWRASVTSQKPSLPPAYQELKAYTDRIRSYLRAQGVPDSVVTIRSIETAAIPEVLEGGRETGRILGYRLTKSFEIRSGDVDGVTRLSQRATELINEGIPLVSPPPEYLYTRLADERVRMLAEATEDARARAEVIAKSAGSEIGPVRDARMGVFQITPRHSTEVSDYGINDVTSLEKDITAVVKVTFAVR